MVICVLSFTLSYVYFLSFTLFLLQLQRHSFAAVQRRAVSLPPWGGATPLIFLTLVVTASWHYCHIGAHCQLHTALPASAAAVCLGTILTRCLLTPNPQNGIGDLTNAASYNGGNHPYNQPW